MINFIPSDQIDNLNSVVDPDIIDPDIIDPDIIDPDADDDANIKEKVKRTIQIQTIILYYQSTLRNVLLIISVSIALFSLPQIFFNNYFFNKYKIFKTLVRITAIFMLLLSFYICFYLFIDVNRMNNYIDPFIKNLYVNINNWIILLVFILFTIFILFCIYVYMTYQFYIKKNKKLT
jgi:hypothetical protein